MCQVVDVYVQRLVSVTERIASAGPGGSLGEVDSSPHIAVSGRHVEETSVTYTIAEPCVDIKDKACIEECPVDCIYEGARMLYIHPDECVDCGACEPVCPVEAIFYEDDVPEQWSHYTQINADFIAELGLPDFTDYELGSLRTGIMAGAACPVEVMRKVISRMHMPGVSICYGMTETSPVSTQTRADDSVDRRVGTVGRVGPHLEIKVVDPATGETVPRGVVGEFCTRGYSVMAGYWNDPQKTAEVIDADGWMHTGDLAEMDPSGYVRIAGRIKDLVVRGGENISPREIEELLHTHPDIVDGHVIGVPDAKYGEELMAVVKLRNDAPELTIERLREYCMGRIARFKIPRYLWIVDEFPMTVTGKVRKVEMRQQALEYLRGQQ